MTTLPVLERARKPGRIRQCPRCNGVGREGKGVARRACSCCSGKGMVSVVEDAPAAYLATQGEDSLEVGAEAEQLVADVLPIKGMIDGDVVIWRLAEGHAPRVVALVTNGPDGSPVARWL